ncbi:MAG: GGDEF domain-containing protein [Fervidobacterium sp.]
MHVNSFTLFDRMFLPALVELSEDKGEFVVKFKYNYEKPISDSVSEFTLKDLVSSFLFYLYGVEKGVYPPIGYFSKEDIFLYAGQVFFLPPLLYSNQSVEKTVQSSEKIFYSPEFLKSGVVNLQTTMYVLGKVIEHFDFEKRYYHMVKKLTHKDPKCRTYNKAWLESFVFLDTKVVESFSKDVLSKIVTDKKYMVVNLTSTRYIDFVNVVFWLSGLANSLPKTLFVYIGKDFTNVPRQLLRKYREFIPEGERYTLFRSLHDIMKFDSILGAIISTMANFERAFIVIDDYENSDHLIRSFLSHLELVDISTKVVVLANKSREFDFAFEVPDFQNNQEILPTMVGLPTEFSYLSLLGSEFSKEDVVHLSDVLSKNLEDTLQTGLKKGVIKFDNGLYTFSESVWRKIYDDLPSEEKEKYHYKLAKRYEKFDSPFSSSILKSGYHYLSAGKDISAVVTYLRFVKKNLETYTFSTERMKEVFGKIYDILKTYNRLNSYAFNSLLLKFRYQSSEKLDCEGVLDSSKLFSYLRLLKNYVDENETGVLETYRTFFSTSEPDTCSFEAYKKLWAHFLHDSAKYRLDDRIENVDQLAGIVRSINEKNRLWANLKSEYLLLLAYTLSYRKPTDARAYLDDAREIAENYNLKHVLSRIHNVYGILNDANVVSIENFKHAIRLASEIGYLKLTIVPQLNLLRAFVYFGFLDEFRSEVKRIETQLSFWDRPSDIAFFYRIRSFLPMYEQNYLEAKALILKALEKEEQYGLQKSSLRSLILLELLCANFEEAKKLILQNIGEPALKTRALEFLTKMVLAKDDEQFKTIWLEYRDSHYFLLREEILYIFAEKIAKVDQEGFLREIEKWESEYTVGGVNLSLFYVLLAKQKYFKMKGNEVRLKFLESELCQLGNIMKMNHPSMHMCTKKITDNTLQMLHKLRRLNLSINLREFIDLFVSSIYRIFHAQNMYLCVHDNVSNFHYEVSNSPKIPEGDIFSLKPFEILINEKIDEDAWYRLYIYRESYETTDNELDMLNELTLIQELFAGQIKGLVLKERSYMDRLTGLYNRWKFNQLIEELFERRENNFSVFLTDIDDFKKVNDTYGHITGDKVLKMIADILKKNVADDGIVSRYGGEEFVGVIYKDKVKTLELCEKMRKEIEISSSSLFGFKVTISIGIAHISERSNATELIGLADQRLYRAKSMGKNTIVWGN